MPDICWKTRPIPSFIVIGEPLVVRIVEIHQGHHIVYLFLFDRLGTFPEEFFYPAFIRRPEEIDDKGGKDQDRKEYDSFLLMQLLKL